MNILLKNIHLLHPAHPQHGQVTDMWLVDGCIKKIAPQQQADAPTEAIDAQGAYASIGWMDVGTQIGEPGYEHREDIASVSKAALHGGFTAIAPFPNTHPPIHSKSEVQYLQRQSRTAGVEIRPIGAISKNCAGQDLAEIMDMQQAGAIAFSDGNRPVQHAGLLLRALQYAKAINGVVIQQAHDATIAAGGQMHEGYWSTLLGTKGIPTLAETVMLERDIALLQYTESRLHIAHVSSAEAVERIRRAKAAGLALTCSVAVANLVFEDAVLEHFDENYKVSPPLRSSDDRRALLEGLLDGTIDFISTNHVPWDVEAKHKEFDNAAFGMIGLETCYSLIATHLREVLSPSLMVEKLAVAPRKVFDLPLPSIEERASANITLFDPRQSWTCTADSLFSKSKNTPFLGQTLQGKVVGVVHGETVTL